MTFDAFFLEIFNELLRKVTGKLFTDNKIKSITSNAVGKYLSDWFPKLQAEMDVHVRVDQAREHIHKASVILKDMQLELENQSVQLDIILNEVQEKKKIADRYEELANTSQEKFVAFKLEMEEALRKELIAQAEEGKGRRQIASFIISTLTLILGAALGAYFKEIIQWILKFF